jgi:hypothetical protein
MLDRLTFALAGTLFVLTSVPAVAAEPKEEPEAGAAGEGTAEAETAASGGEAEVPASEEQSASDDTGSVETDASAEVASDDMSGGVPGLQLGGYMRGAAWVGRMPDEAQADLKAAYGELALVGRSARSSYGDGYAEARIRYGRQGDLQQTFLDLREAYINAYLGPVDLRLGKQVVVWGRADLLNPTNNLTPNDMRIRSPIEDDRRVGNVGARAFVRLAPIRIEGVWMPSYVATELPTVSLPQYVSFGTPAYPTPQLKNWLEAIRVHLELPSFEMSVSYLHGYSPLPGLTLTSLTFHEPASEGLDPSVVIARTAYKHQVVGFDFSTTLSDIVGVRLEAAYRRPYDYKNLIHAPRPDLQYALGLDHTFGSVMVIVQYLGRYAFDWQKEEGPAIAPDPAVLERTPQDGEPDRAAYTRTINSELARINQMIFSQTEEIQHLATARVEWRSPDDTLSLSAVGMVNVSTQEWLAMPKIGYRLSDTMTAYAGAELGSGPRGTLFGLVDKTMSAGYVELRAAF